MATRALLHLNGTNGSTVFTDAVGVYSWASVNSAQLTTGTVKYGSAALQLTTAACSATSTLTGAFFGSAWTVEGWVQFNSVAGNHGVWGLKGATSPFNATYIYNRGNGVGQQYAVSFTGSAVSLSVVGTKTVWATGTWYHMAMTYDSSAGKYYVYVDGVKDGEMASGTAMTSNGPVMALGEDGSSGAILAGFIDEFRISDTCLYPGGTTFTPSTTEFVIDNLITPSAGALILTGGIPTVTNSGIITITPTRGTLSLTGALASVLGIIVPPTGSLSLAGVLASRAADEVRTPATGALSLAGASPVLGTNAALRLRAYGSAGTAHSGIADNASLRRYRATGEVTTFNRAVGASVMREFRGVGYTAPSGSAVLRAYGAVGQAAGLVTGAAVMRPYRSQQISGAARLRKYQVLSFASSIIAATYRTHVMNTTSNAVTEYTGHRFNSFAQIGGAYYGAGPDGFILLEGVNDAGTNIDWRARTGQIDDKQIGLKRLPEVVMGLRASGPLRVRVYPDDDRYFDYMLPNVKTTTIRQHRVKPGKGMASRWFMVEVQGVANAAMEMDSMQLNMTPTTRRIG